MHRGNDVTAYGNKLRSIAAASLPAEIPAGARGIIPDADGTISISDRDGSNVQSGFPVRAGVDIPVAAERIVSVSGPTKIFYTLAV